MPAIDTLLFDVHNTATSAASLTAATVSNSGDSTQVRVFPGTAYGDIFAAILQGTSPPRILQVRSPLMHDNTRGLEWETNEAPAQFLFPPQAAQQVQPGDTLTVSMDAAASSDTIAALSMYYSSLPGVSARLASWGDIAGSVKSIKPVEVDVTSSATIGAWVDTLITTTENLLHANSDYAVLGFEASAALGVVGVKGQETGNLRICCPGSATTQDITNYFVLLSDRHQRPMIPVFNGFNAPAYYVSCAANTASVASKVQLILAELSTRFSG